MNFGFSIAIFCFVFLLSACKTETKLETSEKPTKSLAILMAELAEVKAKVKEQEEFIQKAKLTFEEHKKHIQALEAVASSPKIGGSGLAPKR